MEKQKCRLIGHILGWALIAIGVLWGLYGVLIFVPKWIGNGPGFGLLTMHLFFTFLIVLPGWLLVKCKILEAAKFFSFLAAGFVYFQLVQFFNRVSAIVDEHALHEGGDFLFLLFLSVAVFPFVIAGSIYFLLKNAFGFALRKFVLTGQWEQKTGP